MNSKLTGEQKIKIFMSYAHEDEKYKDELDIALIPLKRLNIIEVWHDRKILPGENWANQIDESIDNADLVILLVSKSFIKSDYCYEIEMQRALKRVEIGEAVIVPIILQHCLYEVLEFARFQMLPKDAKPIDEFNDKNKIYTDIARELKIVIEKIIEKKKNPLSNMPIYDNMLSHAASGVLKAATSRYETEGIVRRFLKGSIYMITKKGNSPLEYFGYEVGDSFRVTNSNIGMKYESLGGTNSILGFPISELRPAWDYYLRDWRTKGFVQWFEGGNIYFTEGYGARVLLSGKIRQKFIEYEDEMIKNGKEMTGGKICLARKTEGT